MTAYVSLAGVKKSFGPKVILEDVSFHLNAGERVALVGENGAGKTTLARLLTGSLAPDSGEIRFGPDVSIGYLPQEVALADPDGTVRAYIETGLDSLSDQMRALEERLAHPAPEDDMSALLAAYGELQDTYMRRGGYDLDHRMAAVFGGLGIAAIAPNRPLNTLSGGEKTRVALAGLLLHNPDLLILDEPTNHLDFAALEWLETTLRAYSGGVLLISHDRRFIDAVVTQIMELTPNKAGVEMYHGNYASYLQQRETALTRAMAAFESQRDEMKRLQGLMAQTANRATHRKGPPPRDNDKFIPQLNNEQADRTASAKIKDAKTRLAALESDKLSNPNRAWRVRFNFDPLPLTSQEVIRLEDVGAGYEGKRLFDGVNAIIRNGERVVLAAPNGTGKSTLLRLILARGVGIHVAARARVGYLDQENETLNPAQTVLESYTEVSGGTASEAQTELHRTGLFSADLAFGKRVGDLSLGQGRKLALARLIASRANLLLLDEPTNHLDFTAIEALESALCDFGGTLLAVSHDRRFIEKVATRVWRLEGGKLLV